MLNELKSKFEEIKKMGNIKATRSGSTAIGKTFEDLLGKKEDNYQGPDFGDIEIKTKRELSNSYVTLFTKAPDYPKKANNCLRETYGYISSEHNNMKILHTSIFTNSVNNMQFRIVVDRKEEKVYICNENKNIAYYTFKGLSEKLNLKLKNLAIVSATSERRNDGEYFSYNSLQIYSNPSFDKFLKLIEEGKIMIDIRIGVYHNIEKPNYGKTHDHGTGFRIKQQDVIELYENNIQW